MTRIYCLKKKVEKRKSVFFFLKKEYIQIGESQEVQKSLPHPDLSPACILGVCWVPSLHLSGGICAVSPLEGPLPSRHSQLLCPRWLELFCHHYPTVSFYSLFCSYWKLVQNHTSCLVVLFLDFVARSSPLASPFIAPPSDSENTLWLPFGFSSTLHLW